MLALAYFLGIALLLLLLVKSANLVQDSLSVISNRLKISPFITGFILLSIASSLPEISVAVNASVQDIPDLSVGNIFGATVFLLTISIGTLAIKRKEIPFRETFGIKEVIIASLLILTQIIVILDSWVSFGEGMLLMFFYLIFVVYLIYNSKKHKYDESSFTDITRKEFLAAISKSAIGCVMLIILSNIIVRISADFAIQIGIPEVIVGLILLGIGTNLPELTIMLTSRSENSNKLAVGNIIGSATTNVFTLGLLGILLPHRIDDVNLLIPVGLTLIITCIFFSIFAWSSQKITRREGLFLIAIYIILFIYELSKTF